MMYHLSCLNRAWISHLLDGLKQDAQCHNSFSFTAFVCSLQEAMKLMCNEECGRFLDISLGSLMLEKFHCIFLSK